MCPIVPTLQCGLVRSNFSFAITQPLAPSCQLSAFSSQFKTFVILRTSCSAKDLCNSWLSLVVRADEFLFFDQFVDYLPIKLAETFREALAENFKPAMPIPEIPHPILAIADRLAIHFGCDVAFGLP